METFYMVEGKYSPSQARIESLIEYNLADFFKARVTPAEPFEMEIDQGKSLYDLVFFQDIRNFAISQKMYNLLQEHAITGWKAYEVRIKGAEKKYYGFQVVGKCGKLQEPKEVGFYTGVKFDFNSWDKSDFFCPDGTLELFCTPKVRDLLVKNKITNINFEDISQCQLYSRGSE